MKSYATLLIKQLTIAALFLSCVTVVSLGIRQVRFTLHRTHTLESPVIANVEPDPDPADSHTVDAVSEPKYANASDWDVEDKSEPQLPTTPVSVKKKPPKSKDSKDLEKISLSDHENLYRTKKGELWYVSKQPDGKTMKMQVRVDETTGEMILVDVKAGGSKDLKKVSLGEYDNLYITAEGEQWYVSEQPDGSSSKSRVEIDDTTGEITILEDYSDNGKERETKD